MSYANRRGLTVVELMAALVLAGIAVLGASSFLTVTTDASARLSSRAARNNTGRISERHLRDALIMSEAAESGARPFFGDGTGATFASRCRTAGSWLRRCVVFINIARYGSLTLLEFGEDEGVADRVFELHEDSRLIYRLINEGRATWITDWGTSITAPVAIGVITGSDTIVFSRGPQ